MTVGSLHRSAGSRSLILAATLTALVACIAPTAAQDAAADARRAKVAQSIGTLDAVKFGKLLDHLGVTPSNDLLNCLCPGEYSFHYFTGGPSGTSCRRIGPLGGLEFSGFVNDRIASCAAAYPLDDGRNVLDVIAAAANAAKPATAVCSNTPAPGDIAGMRLASGFNYPAWPGLFNEISPEQIVWYFSQNDREALKLMGDKITGLGNAIIETTLGLGKRSVQGGTDLAAWAKDAGYDILVNNERDLRIDVGLAEFAFRRNPKTGQFETSEFVLKYAPEMEGVNVEVGAGVEHGQWDGRLKFGFSFEKSAGSFQVEGKFGLEYDSNVTAVTSLDDGPPVAAQSYLGMIRTKVENLIAGLNPYVGGALGPQTEIGPGEIAIGPEVTKVFRDPSVINRLYSDWVFSDMNAAFDQLLVQQKAVEAARHSAIRNLATRLGVQNAECLSINDATLAIHTAWIKIADQIGVSTSGREIKDIRKDLESRGFPVR